MIVMPRLPSSERVTVIFAIAFVVAIAAMTALLLWHLRQQELKRAEHETVSLSHIIAEQTSRSLQSVDLALDVALNRMSEAERLGLSLDEVAIHAMLRSRVEVMPQLRSMFIVDSDGVVVNSALGHPGPKFSVNDRDYFLNHKSKETSDLYFSAPVVNRVDGQRTIFISRRIRGANGQFKGIVAASLNLAYFESLYRSIRFENTGPIALYRLDGTIVASTPNAPLPPVENQALHFPIDPSREGTQIKTIRTTGDDPGIVTFRSVQGIPMIISVRNSDSESLSGWRNTARTVVSFALLNILLVISAAGILVRRQKREALLAEAARESSNQLSAMVNSAMDGIVTVDTEHRILVFNPAAQKMFGYDLREIQGKPLSTLIPERFRPAHDRNLSNFTRSDVTARLKDSRMDIIGLRSDGREFPVESTIAQVTLNGKRMLTAILRDIGDRRRAENELRESHQELRELASSLQAVREEERTSIARELHDELGQQLLRLRMDLSWLSGRLKDAPPALQDKLSDMKSFVAGTVDTLRRVTTRLRPPLLDDLGLAEAAQWQLNDFSKRTGIEAVASISLDGANLDERTSINIFRILQESLTNIARHSAATRIAVSLTASDSELRFDISDNGGGAAINDQAEPGHGLIGIRERTLMLGGRIVFASEPGSGFSTSIRIPLLQSIPSGAEA